MRKITYTTKLHVHRLELMLNKPDICKRCPAIDVNSIDINISGIVHTYKNNPCIVCRGFLGYTIPKYETKRLLANYGYCPCIHLGQKAIPLTLKAIQKYRKETT